MEVNEKIVEEYIKLVKNWFYMTDLSVSVVRGYSNIDLLAYDPKNNNYYDMEIKYRSAAKVSRSNDDEMDKYFKQMTRKERKQTIEKIIGNDKNIIKVFITTRNFFDKNGIIETKFIEKMQKNKYKCEIWYFDDIVPKLYEYVDKKGKYNTELTQTIRLIKTYINNRL